MDRTQVYFIVQDAKIDSFVSGEGDLSLVQTEPHGWVQNNHLMVIKFDNQGVVTGVAYRETYTGP